MKPIRAILLMLGATLFFWLFSRSILPSVFLGLLFAWAVELHFKWKAEPPSPEPPQVIPEGFIQPGDIYGEATDNEGHDPDMPVLKKNTGTTYGTANWENPELLPVIINKNIPFKIDGEGYYIGTRAEVIPLMHGVCVAGSGQGKGVCLILPNLLRVPHHSWFVLDPKGENAAVSASWQKSQGQRVVMLDPWNEQKRLGAMHGIEPVNFNPLSFIKGNLDELPESCGVIADMLVPDNPSSKDQYWNSRARTLIKTYIMHLVTARPDEDQHLGTIYRWLRLPIGEDRIKLWIEMRLSDACDNLVRDGINQFYGMNEDDGPLPSIISNAQDNTEFLESAALRRSLTNNGFDPYDLTDGKTTVYLCLPERFLNSHSRWLRLVVGVCLKACNYRPGKRVNFLLDEFAILGKMADVERAFAFSRGQNISVWIFVQSLTQLIDTYGEHAASGFLANARLRQFFGVFDLYTQKYLSEYIGETTVQNITKNETTTKNWTSGTSRNVGATSSSDSEGMGWSYSKSITYSDIGRRLLTVEEAGKMHQIITLIDGHKFLVARLPFWDSIFDAVKSGRYTYYPLSKDAWTKFKMLMNTDDMQQRQLATDFQDLGATLIQRADGQLRQLDEGQKGLPI